ncbi:MULTISPECIES: LamG-like jellyroll fold domain-containing protein [unclassified Anabaena]|uniref:LamG-like jellyroll fold domain-containing protein n=1 Tax=unclassified Anabaena TaxID=2619674 RepID=UPI0039C5DD4B
MQYALTFDGQDDYILLGKKPEFKIEKEITLEAWVYCQKQRRRAGIISNVFDTNTTESGYGILLDGKSGVFFALKTSSKRIQYFGSKVDSLKLNQWNHVAVTYDGEQMKLYLDGVEIAAKSSSDSGINYEPENDLLIGTYKDNNETYPFLGKIAEVRLWQVARTQSEIKENMHQSLMGNELGLVGYWPLNEGSSNITHDLTKNANHGTINGANWMLSEVPFTHAKSNFELGVAKTMSKEKKTTANSIPAESANSQTPKKAEEIKSHLLATGLEDYGFWWEEMAKAHSNKSEPDKPFRRGRIWM